MTSTLAPSPSTPADFNRRLWLVCFGLPLIGTLMGICAVTPLVLIFSDYPFATRLQTVMGFAILIFAFGFVFMIYFPPVFRWVYLSVVRRHPPDAKIAIPYGFLLGISLPLLAGVIAGGANFILSFFDSAGAPTRPFQGLREMFGFIAMAGFFSAIPGALIGPLAAMIGLRLLRPHDPHFAKADVEALS